MPAEARPRGLLRPEVKSYDCPDHDPIETWVPGEADVLYWLTLAIGLPGSAAADCFQACVATPGALNSNGGRRAGASARGPGQGRGRLRPIVLEPYSWAGVVRAVDERLAACQGRDWREIQEKLRVCFAWEYEGMR